MSTVPTGFGGVPTFGPDEHEAMLAILADLRYPIGPHGEVLGFAVEAIKPIVAYHLVRCGWRPDLSRRKIKARKITGPGVIEDAVTWVSVTEPDDPLANLAHMTIAEIDALPELDRIEARRRLGMLPDPLPAPGWRASPTVSITEEEP